MWNDRCAYLCLFLSLVHSTSLNKVSCLYERLIWFLSVVHTSSFTIFSSNFSPLYVHIYFYLFVCCPLLNCTNVLLLLLLVVIFPLRRDFCWHVQDISRLQIFFLSKSCCVLHYYMWGNEPRAIRLLYKKDKNKSFPGFCCNSFSRYILIIRQVVVSCWIRSRFIFFMSNFFWCYSTRYK